MGDASRTEGNAGSHVHVPHIPRREEVEDEGFSVKAAFTTFILAGFGSAPLAEFFVDGRFGFAAVGMAQELALVAAVALLLFAVVAAGFGVRSFPLLLAGLVVTDLAAFLAYAVMRVVGLTVGAA